MSNAVYLSDDSGTRPGGSGGSNALLKKIQRAYTATLPEPNLSLNLDVADYINAKQGSAPRDACITILKLINSRNTRTAVFALSLLDVLVKNCGYPIHLQISRKEFLNELVKRLPERPPVWYGKVQGLILTAIEEWYQTIAKHSDYKDDMRYIRDMHNLLKYKGYVFPKINQEDLAVLRPSHHLKTPSEIQKEQEIAQAAKLEELIRRGRPEDLREANKLMKVMAGFKEDNAVQAKKTLTEEMTKLKHKAALLGEILDACEDNKVVDNETMTELYSSLKSSQSKFQKIIEEQQDDDIFVQDLLQFNETVNQLLRRYHQSAKPNNMENDHNVLNISMGQSDKPVTTLANEINLIDFDNDDELASSDQPTSKNNKAEFDDLLGDLNSMSFSQPSPNYGLGGSISLGSGKPAPPVQSDVNHDSLDILVGLSSTGQSEDTKNVVNSESDIFGDLQSSPNNEGRICIAETRAFKFDIEAKKTATRLTFNSYLSNTSTQILDQVVIQLAVPKSCSLKLQPQSAGSIKPNTINGIIQEGSIEGISAKKPLKIRWKITYNIGHKSKEESSIFTFPNI